MFSKFHRFMSSTRKPTDSALMQMPVNSLWNVIRLRNSTSYLANIIPPQDKPIALKQPKLVLCFENRVFQSPIKDAVFAWHPEGYLTSLIYARTGVSQKLYQLFQGMTYTIYDRNDPNPRVAFTKNLNTNEGKAEAMRIIETLANITPFSSAEWAYVDDLFNVPTKTPLASEHLKIETQTDKPYFKSVNAIPVGGAVQRYDSRYDAVIPTEIPAIHQAILDVDEPAVALLLQNNPECANHKDPSGTAAHELARRLGLLSILKLCFDARSIYGVMSGNSDFSQQKRYEFMLKRAEHHGILAQPWTEQIRQISYSMLICIPPVTIDNPLAYLHEQRKEYAARIDAAKGNRRALIHQGCIDGDLPLVQQQLAEKTDLLECRDPLGFTPLLLAMANGHEALSLYLIKKGASLSTYSIDNIRFRAIDNVSTPEMMELLLYYHDLSLAEFNSRLADAVRANDFPMVKIILFYLKKLLQDQVGLTPFDLALKWAKPNDLRIIEFFLKYWTWHVPDGPYDTKPFAPVPSDPIFTPEMEALFIAHNRRIDARVERKKIGQTVIKESLLTLDNQGIESVIISEDKQYRSLIKPAHLLTADELNELLAKPDIFKFLGGEKARNQSMYFKSMLLAQETSADRQFYVDIWTDESGVITNFFSFDVERLSHADYGDLILFHGKLACNFVPIGFSDLNFQRISASLAQLNPQAQTYVFFRAIPPGYGMSYIPPGISFYPKICMPENLVQSIFATKGIKIENRIVGTDVNARAVPSFFQLPQEFHRHLTQGKADKAVPVCYSLREEDLVHVHHKLALYGVGDQVMRSFIDCWNEFEAKNHVLHSPKL